MLLHTIMITMVFINLNTIIIQYRYQLNFCLFWVIITIILTSGCAACIWPVQLRKYSNGLVSCDDALLLNDYSSHQLVVYHTINKHPFLIYCWHNCYLHCSIIIIDCVNCYELLVEESDRPALLSLELNELIALISVLLCLIAIVLAAVYFPRLTLLIISMYYMMKN